MNGISDIEKAFPVRSYFSVAKTLFWCYYNSMNELDILKLVASRLNDAEFDYMLSGSVALTFYGKPRMTRDISVVSLEDLIISKLYWANKKFLAWHLIT